MMGQHDGAAVSIDASLQEGPEFDSTSQRETSCVEFACSPCDCEYSLWVLGTLDSL